MEHDQPLSLLCVGHRRDRDAELFFVVGQGAVNFFLDLEVRHHLAADLGEAAQPPGNVDVSV